MNTEIDDNDSARSRGTRQDKRRQTGGKGTGLSRRYQTGGLRLPNTNPHVDERVEEQETSSSEQDLSKERKSPLTMISQGGSITMDVQNDAAYQKKHRACYAQPPASRRLPSPPPSSDVFVRDKRVFPLPHARAEAFSEHSARSCPTKEVEGFIHGYTQLGGKKCVEQDT